MASKIKNDLCESLSQVQEMLHLPLNLQPTVEFALKELELPLSREDVEEFFEAKTEFNLWALDQQSRGRVGVSYGSNMSPPTLTVQTPMIVTAICAYGYVEPHAMLIEGNQFGTQAIVEAMPGNRVPASPINLRNQAGALQALYGTPGVAVPAGFSACPAHLEVGSPGWNLIWAYLSAYRLVMDCPHSAFEQIIRERLIDIGNCCSLADFSGFGSSEASHLYWVRRLNNRLNELQNAERLPGLPAVGGTTQGADPGYFVPLNSEQNADFEIVPNRTTGVARSYGNVQSPGDINNERWFRLPYPIALDENTKIKLFIERDGNGDSTAAYYTRMLEEGCMKQCLGPIPAVPNNVNFPIDEADKEADPDGGVAAFTQIPAGLVRIGLGLKGVYVRDDVCHSWKSMMKDKDAVTRVMSGDLGFCGRPGIETVPAGHVGER